MEKANYKFAARDTAYFRGNDPLLVSWNQVEVSLSLDVATKMSLKLKLLLVYGFDWFLSRYTCGARANRREFERVWHTRARPRAAHMAIFCCYKLTPTDIPQTTNHPHPPPAESAGSMSWYTPSL